MFLFDWIDIFIVGVGFVGLLCVYYFDWLLLIVEVVDYVGGKVCSEYIEGFIFDVIGYWLYLCDFDMKVFVLKFCGEDYFMGII